MKWLKGVYIIVTANLFTLAAAGSGVNIGDIIVTVVTFLILLALLRKFAWGPLKKSWTIVSVQLIKTLMMQNVQN